MVWRSLAIGCSVFGAAMAGAASLDATIKNASAMLQSGQPVAALRHYREAQVEHPDSARLLFAIGCAEAAAAEHYLRENDPEAAAAHLQSARETFTRAAADAPGTYGKAATYNAATCLIYRDATFDPEAAYEQRVENMQGAVDALEAYLAAWPRDTRALKNLDHARYTLALLRQNPPEEREPEEESAEDQPATVSELQTVETEIPNARVEVVDGSTAVLRLPAEFEDAP